MFCGTQRPASEDLSGGTESLGGGQTTQLKIKGCKIKKERRNPEEIAALEEPAQSGGGPEGAGGRS